MSQSTTFLHTADWQLGKPFGSVDDPDKQAQLRKERIDVIQRIGRVARENSATFILVAGDMFDSSRPSQSTIVSACSAIGQLRIPVYVIPGNHDHGGPGSLWESDFFRTQCADLAPNFHYLLEREPRSVPGAVIFPCPLGRRHEMLDPTDWLRSMPDLGEWDPDLPRIVLAHGTVQDFNGALDDESIESTSANLLHIERLAADAFDYVALGDWHGTFEVSPNAWYPGTPEMDRFPKSGDHDPGNVLVVNVARGKSPDVTRHRTTAIEWNSIEFEFTNDESLDTLFEQMAGQVGQRVNQDLLKLSLRGALGLEALARLEKEVEVWSARLIRLRLENNVQVAPTVAELDALTRGVEDPLIARVAARLMTLASANDPDSVEVARHALRELHLAVRSP